MELNSLQVSSSHFSHSEGSRVARQVTLTEEIQLGTGGSANYASMFAKTLMTSTDRKEVKYSEI